MFLNKNATAKVVNAANTTNKHLKVYNFKDVYKAMPSNGYGPDVQKSLVDRGCTLVADNGAVKVFEGLAGYEYACLIEQTETDYLICFESWRAHAYWMRNFSMITHIIEKFLPAQQ